MNHWLRSCACAVLAAGASVCWGGEPAKSTVPMPRGVHVLGSIQGMGGSVTVDPDGSYSINSPDIPGAVIHSDVEAVVDGRVLRSSAYPLHQLVQSEFSDDGGPGSSLTVTHTGLPGTPDLVCSLRLFRDRSWGEIEVKVQNGTAGAISVAAIRAVHAIQAPVVNLNGPQAADRILSDSYSEDRPQLAIRELGDAPKAMHRAVGSQLIYNRQQRREFVPRRAHLRSAADDFPSDRAIRGRQRLHPRLRRRGHGHDRNHERRVAQGFAGSRTGGSQASRGSRGEPVIRAPHVRRRRRLPRATGAVWAGSAAAAQGTRERRDPHRVVELDGLLLWAQPGYGRDECVLACTESQGPGLHVLPDRRGIPIRARRIHHRRCKTLSGRHWVHRRLGAPQRADLRYVDRSLRGVAACLGVSESPGVAAAQRRRSTHPHRLRHGQARPSVRARYHPPRRAGLLETDVRHAVQLGLALRENGLHGRHGSRGSLLPP